MLFTWLFSFIISAHASGGSCADLFDTLNPRPTAYQSYLLEKERRKTAGPEQEAFAMLNPNLQLRFFQVGGEKQLRLLERVDLGQVSQRDLNEIQSNLRPELIEVTRIGHESYRVKIWDVVENVTRDNNTGTIKYDDPQTKAWVDNLTRDNSSPYNALLFFDVNSLGLVNFLPGGHSTGNRYLKLISEIVFENLRYERHTSNEKDLGFKYAGDEFFFLLNQVNHNNIDHIARRIEVAIRQEPRIQGLKSQALEQLETFKSSLLEMKSYNELSKNSNILNFIVSKKEWNRLSDSERRRIIESESHFQSFMHNFVESNTITNISNSILRIDLGVSASIGLLDPNARLEQSIEVLDSQMQTKKLNRKQELGIEHLDKIDVFFPEN